MTDVEWQVYCALWDLVVSNFSVEPECILYYRTPAEVCLDRIRVRGRVEESEITPDYLRQLEALHDEWLLHDPRALVLDGTRRWTAREILETAKDLIAQAEVVG